MRAPKPPAARLWDWLFPPHCPWCGELAGRPCCAACAPVVEKLRAPARPLPMPEEADGVLRAVYASFYYSDPVDEGILRLKFSGDSALAGEMGVYLAETFRRCGLAGQYDAVVPVPVSKKTKKQRTYNQSALLARHLAEAAGLPVWENVLQKHRETLRQMDLDSSRRHTNVQGAYTAPNAARLGGSRILLVDDVVTTGSTLCECARTLLRAGAGACGALCLAAVP